MAEKSVFKAYEVVFKSPNGDEVVRDLINRYLLRPIHDRTQPENTIYQAGAHDAILRLLLEASIDITKVTKQTLEE